MDLVLNPNPNPNPNPKSVPQHPKDRIMIMSPQSLASCAGRHQVGEGWLRRMFPARAPETAREGACAPRKSLRIGVGPQAGVFVLIIIAIVIIVVNQFDQSVRSAAI